MTEFKWWQKTVFYQIYPRSFADGNGDGIGDFKGMIGKLDYLKDLGVGALWLSPHFPSPNWDCGYDISDYEDVAPEYGTLDQFKTFLTGAHARGMHVILDLVLNHTSDQHPWFLESRSSHDNPKADWYVWESIPPNNWQSCFDGSAWTYDPQRKQYYYHYFMKQQPDLNWHNLQVREAIWNAVRFWLDLGVDGFRLDAIGTLFEDPDLTPHTVPVDLAGLRFLSDIAKTTEDRARVETYWKEMFKYQLGQPGIHAVLHELRAVLDEYPGDRVLIGEDDDLSYLGNGHDEIDMVFNFPLMRLNVLSAQGILLNQQERLTGLAAISPEAWGCNTLGNHDTTRLYSHYSQSEPGSDGSHDTEKARLATAMLLTLRGTPFLYNGEEIGMTDYLIPNRSGLRDTMATWYFDHLVQVLKMDPTEAARLAAAMSRDKNRTPMQWRNAPNAGFCPEAITPWLPVNPNYSNGINVQEQEKNAASMLTFYRHLLRVRKANPSLVIGDFNPIQSSNPACLAFRRSTPEQSVWVVLNFSDKPALIDSDELSARTVRILFSSIAHSLVGFPRMTFAPYEICLIELK